MGLFFYKWSKTAASNASADANVNMAEGMAPSAVNDGVRAVMASAAGYRDDISGAIVTGGTSTAFTVTSNQIFDNLANMSGAIVAFTPHATNGATVTLNVDGLGAKPLRPAPSVELTAGVLIQGTPYTALYNNSDGVWYLHNFYVNPYVAPIGGMIEFIGSTAPNSAFVFPYGQAISRTTYSVLFGMISTTFGVGDGSTTFNIPDLRGRVVAGKDDMGGSSANRLTNADDGLNGDTLGATGGGETQVLVTANLPPYTPSGTNSGGAASFTYTSASFQPASTLVHGTSITPNSSSVTVNTVFTQPTFAGNAQGGTSTAFGVVQPTIVLNKLLRVI